MIIYTSILPSEPYACETCGVTFFYKSRLERHLQSAAHRSFQDSLCVEVPPTEPNPDQLQDSSMELVQVKLSVHKLLLSPLRIQDLGQYATPPFESCV